MADSRRVPNTVDWNLIATWAVRVYTMYTTPFSGKKGLGLYPSTIHFDVPRSRQLHRSSPPFGNSLLEASKRQILVLYGLTAFNSILHSPFSMFAFSIAHCLLVACIFSFIGLYCTTDSELLARAHIPHLQ